MANGMVIILIPAIFIAAITPDPYHMILLLYVYSRKTTLLRTVRYASPSKQAEMSQHRNHFHLDQFHTDGCDNYAALDKHASRITKLVSMAKPKDHDDEAKARFLSSAVIGAKFSLSAVSILSPDSNYTTLITALTISLRELYIHMKP